MTPSHGGLQGGGPCNGVLRLCTGPVILSGLPIRGLLPEGGVPTPGTPDISQGVPPPPTLTGCPVGAPLPTKCILGGAALVIFCGGIASVRSANSCTLGWMEFVASVCDVTAASVGKTFHMKLQFQTETHRNSL